MAPKEFKFEEAVFFTKGILKPSKKTLEFIAKELNTEPKLEYEIPKVKTYKLKKEYQQ